MSFLARYVRPFRQNRPGMLAGGRSGVISRFALFLVMTITGATPVAADETVEREAELERVQQRIEAMRQEIRTDIARIDQETRRLEVAELDIARLTAGLEALRVDRRKTEQRLGVLRQDQQAHFARLAEEQESLVGHLRSAYMTGRQERVRMLLSQDDPSALGRLMAYYGYLSRLRAERMESISVRLEELDAVSRAVEAETENLRSLETERQKQLAALEQSNRDRSAAIRGLDQRIADQGLEVNRLVAQEAALKALIARIRTALEDFPFDAQQDFATLKGQLPWPVSGRLIKDYGQPRAGGRLRWNGVLVAADRGAEVRALHHGRVVYADWLPGLGLLIIVEHGGGYLTLYGHNQALLKLPGEWVKPGDVIATVGDSGGRPEPALYFEIRSGVTPLNPHDWTKTRLSGR